MLCRRGSPPTIDNYVFRLHYQATIVILLVLSLLIGLWQYFGEVITCTSSGDVPSGLLNTFCWIHPTFSLPDSWNKHVGQEVPFPGFDIYTPDKARVFHFYYPWVCYVLLLQAAVFYIPRHIWKVMEGGRIKHLIAGFKSPNLPDDVRETNRRLLVDYVVAHFNKHRLYFASYVIAEVLNFVNVIGQLFVMDAFLGGQFLDYGPAAFEFTGWESSVSYNPILKVFPTVAKCTFHRYGRSGDVQRHDAMCMLPMNIFNGRMYVFLWFWFVILAILSGLSLVYTAVVTLSTRSRLVVTSLRSQITKQNCLEDIILRCQAGDWFVLDLLSKNLDPLCFRDVISDISRNLDGKSWDQA